MEILIAIISGIISSLGMGGGTILIIGMTLFLNVEQKVAQASNLFFFIPTAITATIKNSRAKRIDWKVFWCICSGSIIGTFFGIIIAKNIDTNILRRLFGFFLLTIVIYEIYSLIVMNIKCKKSNNKNIK